MKQLPGFAKPLEKMTLGSLLLSGAALVAFAVSLIVVFWVIQPLAIPLGALAGG